MSKVLKFSASWCGPCRALSSVIAGAEVRVPVEEIDVDVDRDRATKYAIRGLPTCILVDDAGREIKRKVGLMTGQEFRHFVGEHV